MWAFADDAAFEAETWHIFGIRMLSSLGVCLVVGLLDMQLVFKEVVSKCCSLTCL